MSVRTIIFTKDPISSTNKKFLVPNDLTLGHFVHKLRESFLCTNGNLESSQPLKLKPEEALFCYISHLGKEILVAMSTPMSQLHHEYQQPTGEIQLVLRSEEVFG